MEPADHAARAVPGHLAPGSQPACYLPWLKVSVALRYVLTFPWTPEAWREVRQHIPWLLRKQETDTAGPEGGPSGEAGVRVWQATSRRRGATDGATATGGP
jgi:hypothetical protein